MLTNDPLSNQTVFMLQRPSHKVILQLPEAQLEQGHLGQAIKLCCIKPCRMSQENSCMQSVFSGATIPGRPAHVRAADAKKYAEAKAALLKPAGRSESSPKAIKTSSYDAKAPVRPDSGDVSAVIPSMASVKVEDPVQSPTARESAYHASQAAHAALDAAGGDSEFPTGETGLLKVALSAMGNDADGAVSVKLEFTEPLPSKAEDSARDPSSGVPGVQAVVVDSKPADSAPEAAAPAAVHIDNALQDLSLPASPGGGVAAAEAHADASQSVDVAGAFSSAMSADSSTIVKQQEVLSNPLFHDGTDPARVSEEK